MRNAFRKADLSQEVAPVDYPYGSPGATVGASQTDLTLITKNPVTASGSPLTVTKRERPTLRVYPSTHPTADEYPAPRPVGPANEGPANEQVSGSKDGHFVPTTISRHHPTPPQVRGKTSESR